MGHKPPAGHLASPDPPLSEHTRKTQGLPESLQELWKWIHIQKILFCDLVSHSRRPLTCKQFKASTKRVGSYSGLIYFWKHKIFQNFLLIDMSKFFPFPVRQTDTNSHLRMTKCFSSLKDYSFEEITGAPLCAIHEVWCGFGCFQYQVQCLISSLWTFLRGKSSNQIANHQFRLWKIVLMFKVLATLVFPNTHNEMRS